MSDDIKASAITSDRPESDPKRDLLGYAPFARQLARSILAMSADEGMVLGIYAPWGSGKSTLLNFVEHHLDQQPEENRPVVVRFNPWWFSGDEALARHFFSQIEAVAETKMKATGKKLKGKLSSFAESVSAVPAMKFVPVLGTNAEELAKSVAAIAKGANKDVVALKKEVAEVLSGQPRTVLVVIDDIDRLAPEEVRQLFRLVKAVADFPKVVYLLAFDKDVVIKALGGQAGVDGSAYLEKIVQVPFELPAPDRQSLQRMFIGKLNAIMADLPDENFNQEHWANVFVRGVSAFLETPRDVVRLSNSLAVTFPAVSEEVNPVDFVAVEALRIFEPELYDFVRRNPESFAGVQRNSGKDEGAAFRKSWLEKASAEKRSAVESLMDQVFPNTGRTIYTGESESRWRRERRVCSPDVFPAYFRLSLPAGAVSNSEIREIVAIAGDTDRLASRLRDLISEDAYGGVPRIRAALDRLQDYTAEGIPSGSLEAFLATILQLGDEITFSDDDPVGFYDVGNDVYVGRLFWQCMSRLDPARRFPFLRETLRDTAGLSTAVREVMVMGQQQGKNGESRPSPKEEWFVTEGELAELESAMASRISDLASRDSLFESEGLVPILYRWKEWGREEDVRDWVAETIADDRSVVRFLSQFLGYTRRQVVGEVAVKRIPRLRPETVREFADTDAIAERMRTLDMNSFEDREQEAVSQFLKEYDAEQSGQAFDTNG